MQTVTQIRSLLTYYERNRGAGHTYTMMNGALNYHNRIFIIAHTMHYAQQLSHECLNAIPVSWRSQFTHQLDGYQYPVLIDNSAMMCILNDADIEISRLQIRVHELQNELDNSKKIL